MVNYFEAVAQYPVLVPCGIVLTRLHFSPLKLKSFEESQVATEE